MASWDDTEFDPDNIVAPPQKSTDKWEGEDEEDDDVKDNWEDDDADKEEVKPVEVKKKKKPLGERIKEKEEKKRQERLIKEEEMKKQQEEEESLTPEDELAEKEKQQKLVEESDFELLKETFGAANQVASDEKSIENFLPTSTTEFVEFAKLLVEKITKFETKPDYVMFLEILFRDCCTGLEADDIKRISNTLNILASEKIKLIKGAKTKKKTTKKALVGGSMKHSKKDALDDYTEDYNEFDDFM